jgi:8-oxo-dGTP diphosphatase
MATEATLIEIIQDGKLLLIKNVRGISRGKWNGPGGKLNPGEAPEQCAIREALEETGLTIKNPFYHGIIRFYNFGKNEVGFLGYIFSAKEFSGEVTQGEAGEVRWFDIGDLPKEEMWPDDQYWLPHLLKEERFDADFYFNGDNSKIIKHEIRVRS